MGRLDVAGRLTCKRAGLLLALQLLVACGNVDDEVTDTNPDAGLGGSSAGGSTAGAPGVGGEANSGTGNVGGIGSDAGAAGEAGESGAGGSGSKPPLLEIPIEPAHARWPVPNSVASGLSHPASYSKSATTVLDNVTGLEWQVDRSPTTLDLAGAIAYCESLSLANYDDWRVPIRIELLSLLAADSGTQPPVLSGLADAYFQSSTTYQSTSNESLTWTVKPGVKSSPASVLGGQPITIGASIQDAAEVRCVRTHTPHEGGDAVFVIGEQSVRDSATKLDWQRVLGPNLDWQEAAAYCASLPIDGRKNWRLPSMQELATLVVDGRQPAIDSRAFPGTEAVLQNWVWTAESYAMTYAPQVRFMDGHIVVAKFYATSSTRCVRPAD